MNNNYVFTNKKKYNTYNRWTNVLLKPKNFTFVKGKIRTYSYDVNVYGYNKIIDTLNIEVSYIGDLIDIDEVKRFVETNYGIPKSCDINTGIFKRDGGYFNFINGISISNKEEYFLAKNRILRSKKISSLFED